MSVLKTISNPRTRKLLIVGGAAILAIITSKQLSNASIYLIVIAMILTYGVDFLMSKFPVMGNYVAGILNFIIILILMPFPASIVLAIVIGYVSTLKVGAGPITLPITSVTLAGIYIISTVIF